MASFPSENVADGIYPGGKLTPPDPQAGPFAFVNEDISGVGARSHNEFAPVSHSRPGQCLPSFFDVINGHIIIKPRTIDMGLVIDSITKTGIIWNVHQTTDAELLTLGETGTAGLTQSGIAPAEFLLRTKSVVVTYIASPDGPVVIDAEYNYNFDIESVDQFIIGVRGVSIPYEPLHSGYIQEYTIKTEVYRAENGTEHRINLYNDKTATRRISMNLKPLTERAASEIQNAITFAEFGLVFVPLWLSESFVTVDTTGIGNFIFCDTTDREFRIDDSVLVYKIPTRPQNCGARQAEIRTVVDVQPTFIEVDNPFGVGFVIGDSVLPIIEATIDTKSRRTARSSTSEVFATTFDEIREGLPDVTIPAPALNYDGFPVFDVAQPPLAPATETFANDFTIRGEVWQKQDKRTQSLPESLPQQTLLLPTITEQEELRNFFLDREGRTKPFWLKSRVVDYRVTASAVGGATQIEVNSTIALQEILLVTRHIYIPQTDSMHRISSGSASGDNVLLDIVPVLPANVSDGAIINNLYFVRFESDTIAIEADGTGYTPVTTRAALSFRELQRETPT